MDNLNIKKKKILSILAIILLGVASGLLFRIRLSFLYEIVLQGVFVGLLVLILFHSYKPLKVIEKSIELGLLWIVGTVLAIGVNLGFISIFLTQYLLWEVFWINIVNGTFMVLSLYVLSDLYFRRIRRKPIPGFVNDFLIAVLLIKFVQPVTCYYLCGGISIIIVQVINWSILALLLVLIKQIISNYFLSK